MGCGDPREGNEKHGDIQERRNEDLCVPLRKNRKMGIHTTNIPGFVHSRWAAVHKKKSGGKEDEAEKTLHDINSENF